MGISVPRCRDAGSTLGNEVVSYSLRLSGDYSVIGVVDLGQNAEVCNGNSFDLSVVT